MVISPENIGGKWDGQRVLVTGAGGFLGSHLCRALEQKGAEVHGVSRSERSAEAGMAHWWKADLTDAAAVRDLWKTVRPDVIVHLSGLSSAGADLQLVLPTFTSLVVSTVNILTVSAEVGCRRIVLAGSLTEPQGNSVEPVLGSPYAAAKWASSAYGLMFSRLYQAPVVIVRPFMTFGPCQDVRKLIPYVTLSLLRGESPKLSSGQWQTDWIYVDDVIQGFLRAVQAPDVEGCAIDLGHGELSSVRTVVQHLVNLTGSRIGPIFGAMPDRPLEPTRAADTDYAFAKLNWKPTTSLLAGLETTVNWYRRHAQSARADAPNEGKSSQVR